jgi:hypothetical protein
MQPRSRTLSSGQLSTPGSYTVLQLAPDSVVILKSLAIADLGSPTGYSAWYVRSARSGALVTLLSLPGPQPATSVWSNWVVLESGDKVQCDAGGLQIRFWISGSVMTGGFDSSIVPIAAGALPAVVLPSRPH